MRASPFTGTIIAICFASGLNTACRQKDASTHPSLTVFAAASLAEVTEDLASDFRAQTGIDVKISIAASGILRRQIEFGAPCDVFISADAVEIDRLAEKKLIVPETRSLLAHNQLVVVARRGGQTWSNPRRLVEDESRIAIGDPRYVPVGRYAREALQRAHLWEAVQPKLIRADSVRVALQYVISRQADFAIVYATDVRTSDCHVVYAFPVGAPQIASFAVVCSATSHRDGSESLIRFFKDDTRAKSWTQRGFLHPMDPKR